MRVKDPPPPTPMLKGDGNFADEFTSMYSSIRSKFKDLAEENDKLHAGKVFYNKECSICLNDFCLTLQS